jgi:hypothetical protein
MSELKTKNEELFTVTSVSVNLGLKANLGNYNMANFNYVLTAQPAEGADTEEVKAALEEIVDGWVNEKLTAIKAKNGK